MFVLEVLEAKLSQEYGMPWNTPILYHYTGWYIGIPLWVIMICLEDHQTWQLVIVTPVIVSQRSVNPARTPSSYWKRRDPASHPSRIPTLPPCSLMKSHKSTINRKSATFLSSMAASTRGRPGLTWARGPPATRAASVTGGDMISPNRLTHKPSQNHHFYGHKPSQMVGWLHTSMYREREGLREGEREVVTDIDIGIIF